MLYVCLRSLSWSLDLVVHVVGSLWNERSVLGSVVGTHVLVFLEPGFSLNVQSLLLLGN